MQYIKAALKVVLWSVATKENRDYQPTTNVTLHPIGLR